MAAPRIPILLAEELSEADKKEQPELHRVLEKTKGKNQILGRMANAPAVGTPFQNMAGVFLNKLELSHHRREVVIVRTATNANSHFEMTQHIPIVQMLGWKENHLTEVITGRLNDPLWDECDRCLVKYADEIFHNVKASDETFDAMAKHLTERELVEVTLMVGQYTMLAGFLNTFRVPNDPVVGDGKFMVAQTKAQAAKGDKKPYAQTVAGGGSVSGRVPRISPPPFDSVPDDLPLKKFLPKAGGFAIMNHAPELAIAFNGKWPWIGKTELSNQRRELCVYRAAKFANSPFEMTAHIHIAKGPGLDWSDQKVTEAVTGNLMTAEFWDDGDRALVKYADEVLHNVNVTDATFAEAAKHLTKGELVEATMIPGFYRMLAGHLNTMRVPVPAGGPGQKQIAQFNAPNRRQSEKTAKL